MLGLNERQFKVLEAIFDFSISHGWMPTIEEISELSRIHPKGISNIVRELKQYGALTKNRLHYVLTFAGISWVKRVKRERNKK
jgi:RIO-like serine/threonine protein kinase